MDGNDLARWTRFAAKGGIGKCTALQDCVAQGADDLMFLKDDEVVVLLQLPQENQYLGYCEGVVGRFHGSAVRFHGKLKKPVFAKRQSGASSSPSRPISHSSNLPSAHSYFASGSNLKTTPPPPSSSRVPSIISTSPSSSQPARVTASSVSPPASRREQSHSRTASTASSSSSHYSTQSRPPSHLPEAVPVHYARTHSTTSSLHIEPPIPSVFDLGSEETQLVSLPTKPPSALPGTTVTPALTDASSAHSSFLLTPAPALATFSLVTGRTPLSPLQGRTRSGSEKPSLQEEANDIGRRSGGGSSVVHVQRAGEDHWSAAETGTMQDTVGQENSQGKNLPAAASETSFKTMSVYSETSVMLTNDRILSMHSDGRGVLREDESEEEVSHTGYRTSAASSLSDLSDGGFGIGMTLLREDDDDQDEFEGDDREDEETAIGHMVPSKQTDHEDTHSLRTPRTPGMRVMNPSSITSSMSESDMASERDDDDTVIPVPHSQTPWTSTSAPVFPSTLSFPASSSSETAISDLRPTNALLPNHATSLTIVSRRTSSIAPTEDEHWESDADIYDDYRYSSASSHSPGRPSSSRASKTSSRSARSRVSSRPPLPDEEGWRRGGDGTSSRKSLGGERSGVSTEAVQESQLGGPPLSHLTPFTRVTAVSVNSAISKTSPQNMDEVSPPATPSATPIGTMSTISPLTRAFRQSDESVYSRRSQEREDNETLEGKALQSEKISTFTTPRRRSPGPERKKTEGDQASRPKSPALASSLREKIQTELRSKNVNTSTMVAAQSQLSVITSRPDDEPSVIVLNDSPVTDGSSDENHLRVASPQSYGSSAPPSPLNPGFPPSPSSMASFPPTAPLTINKSPSSSPITPRHPVSPPAIPFAGIPPPGRPPAHMQYAQQQLPHSQSSHTKQQHIVQGKLPHSESLHSALRMAGQQRASTIHGHVQTDLLTATGPVPISFLLPGMLPPRPQPTATQSPLVQFPPQSQNRTRSPISELQLPRTASPQPQRHALTQTTPTPETGVKTLLSASMPPPNPPPPDGYGRHPFPGAKSDENNATMPPPPSPSTAAPLPRANFFPQVRQVRPRSRSFSGFNSEITEKISQSLNKRSKEEGSQPSMVLTKASRPDSPSSKTPTPPLAPSPLMGPIRGKSGQTPRPSHGPSPLSLPPTTSNSSDSPLGTYVNVPPSPVSRVTPSSMRSIDIQEPHARRSTYRQAPLHISQSTMLGASSVSFPAQRRDSGPNGTNLSNTDDPSSLRPSQPARQSHESDRTHNSFTRSDMSSPPPISTSSPSSSPLAKSGSLRSKISISAMRAKGGPRSIRDGAPETASSTNGPVTPPDEETVQIKDMEFELVRPTVMRASSDLHRNEEAVDSKEGMPSHATDSHHDSSSMRFETHSPGGLSSSTDNRLGSANASSPEANFRKGKVAEANNSVQAHRDRELKWISTMNSGDAAQARKSKKIKKLLIDGVPSSVRYLVWAYLSNSGSKKMPNVYAQLSKRRPTLARDIERDVETSFPDHQTLRDPNGPLVSVIYAYIAMVPDLRYHRGLVIIAGNLLLQSPEEDAFWTFLAMMDGYLRLYFMPTSPQMGIDTALFIKAVEVADGQLAKRVFLELNVRPQELCGVWFSSVFAGTLPLGHLHRVWDLFFYEGIPFLFRVGLAILSLTRSYLLESSERSPGSYTAYLLRPPAEDLHTDPEQFIAQALSVKLKDDDIRKMRLKMTDAAFKQQRAPRISTSHPSYPHLNLQGERLRAS